MNRKSYIPQKTLEIEERQPVLVSKFYPEMATFQDLKYPQITPVFSILENPKLEILEAEKTFENPLKSPKIAPVEPRISSFLENPEVAILDSEETLENHLKSPRIAVVEPIIAIFLENPDVAILDPEENRRTEKQFQALKIYAKQLKAEISLYLNMWRDVKRKMRM